MEHLLIQNHLHTTDLPRGRNSTQGKEAASFDSFDPVAMSKSEKPRREVQKADQGSTGWFEISGAKIIKQGKASVKTGQDVDQSPNQQATIAEILRGAASIIDKFPRSSAHTHTKTGYSTKQIDY
jgi:hypothetical protein